MKEFKIVEAVKIIKENKDTDSVNAIAAVNPALFAAVVRGDILSFATLVCSGLTFGSIGKPYGNEENADDDVEGAAGEDKALEEMSIKELIATCDKMGIKVPKFGKAKKFYIEKINAASGDPDDEETKEDSSEEWGDDEPEKDPYEGKTAKELHAMCKERGIKADIKKPAKFYADLLRKADSEDEEEDTVDDWGDEEEEEAPKKKPPVKGNGKKAPARKEENSKKTQPDDDWDI